MSNQYVLIDYENVQPKNLEILADKNFNVFVFFGINQTKVSRDFLKSMLLLRNKAEVIEMSGSGKNALDFHITYYLGELAAREPKALFHVISKDKGFDPLIKHLKGKGLDVRRESDLAEIPTLRIKDTTSESERIELIVNNLAARGQSRPRKVSTLENTIKTLFATKLEQKELAKLVGELQRRKYIVVNQGKVSYKLPH
ncbi:MAG: PIN domain-containing protein [Woeseiaceae bacterium]